MTAVSKTTKSVLALAALASVGMSMVPSEAEAGWWRGRRNWAVAGGVVAGIAGAALLAGAANAHYGHGYYAAPSCYWVKQRRVTWDGFVVVRNVRVCD